MLTPTTFAKQGLNKAQFSIAHILFNRSLTRIRGVVERVFAMLTRSGSNILGGKMRMTDMKYAESAVNWLAGCANTGKALEAFNTEKDS